MGGAAVKRILGRCVLWTALVIEILSAVWAIGGLLFLEREERRVDTEMVHYFPEGVKILEEWQERKSGVALLAVQIPQDGTEEFVRVLGEEEFEKIEMWNYFPRKRNDPPRIVENGMWRRDWEWDSAYESRPAYHVYDLDTGIYYYIVTER
jgi:hypothetical protein